MGAGRAAEDGEGPPTQVPRLSTMLRSFTTVRGAELDADQDYVSRTKLLQSKKKRSTGAVGSSELARRLLPSWETASREAKEKYETFLKVVGKLLGGDLVGEELYAAASETYNILLKASLPEDGGPRLTAATQFAPQRAALTKLFGHVEEAHLQHSISAARSLKAVAVRPILPAPQVQLTTMLDGEGERLLETAECGGRGR
ncbi:activating signal cointegrator 1 complex subunit, partial [Cymbomonas tetramitiformis]